VPRFGLGSCRYMPLGVLAQRPEKYRYAFLKFDDFLCTLELRWLVLQFLASLFFLDTLKL